MHIDPNNYNQCSLIINRKSTAHILSNKEINILLFDIFTHQNPIEF